LRRSLVRPVTDLPITGGDELMTEGSAQIDDVLGSASETRARDGIENTTVTVRGGGTIGIGTQAGIMTLGIEGVREQTTRTVIGSGVIILLGMTTMTGPRMMMLAEENDNETNVSILDGYGLRIINRWLSRKLSELAEFYYRRGQLQRVEPGFTCIPNSFAEL